MKTSLTKGIHALTGLKIKSMDIGLFNTLIGFEGLKLFNPPDFVDELMIDMPEIYVNYDLGSFIKGNVHLQKETADTVKEFGQGAEKAVEKAVESSKDVERKIGDATKETVEKATDTIKKIVPFGK